MALCIIVTLELYSNSGWWNFESWALAKTWYDLTSSSAFIVLFSISPKIITKFKVQFIFWLNQIGLYKLDYWINQLIILLSHNLNDDIRVKIWWHAVFLHRVLIRKVTDILIYLSVGYYHCDLVLPSAHPERGPHTSHRMELVTHSWKKWKPHLVFSSGEETALPKTIYYAIFHFNSLQHDS